MSDPELKMIWSMMTTSREDTKNATWIWVVAQSFTSKEEKAPDPPLQAPSTAPCHHQLLPGTQGQALVPVQGHLPTRELSPWVFS